MSEHSTLRRDRTIVITGGPTTPEAVALYKPFALADMRAMVMRPAYPGDPGKS